MLFEEYSLTPVEVIKHSDTINKVISKKQYFVNINGKEFEISTKVDYKSSNNLEQNNISLKIKINREKEVSIGTYISNGDLYLSVYKPYGPIFDEKSVYSLMDVINDLSIYSNLNEHDLYKIEKSLMRSLVNKDDYINDDIKIK